MTDDTPITQSMPSVDPAMIEWLCGVQGYPYNFSVEPPIPASWRGAVENYWVADDGTNDPQIQDAIRDTVAEEGRWDNGSSTQEGQ